jgi:molybdopterin synthase catalytic subunit
MKAKVRFFSILREYVGRDELTMDVPEGTSIGGLLNALKEKWPGLTEFERAEGLPILVMLNGNNVDHDSLLKDGDEVALLPPVSGGKMKACILDGTVKVEEEINDMARSSATKGAGALVAFIGFVKGKIGNDRVLGLDYEAYEPYATKRLQTIANDALKDERVKEVRIYHRKGSLKPGEPTIYIFVSSVERGPAFEAARKVLERVKEEVPIFKLERRDDGEFWIVGHKRVKRKG